MGVKVKPGYKQTEVGVIPEDWEIKSVGDIAVIVTGSTPPTKVPANYGDEFLFASPADLGKNKYIVDTEKRLSKTGFLISRKFPNGSILFTCIGSTIGKCGIASEEMTSNQQINAIFPSSDFANEYIYYVLDLLAPRIKALAGEQAVPIINKTQFATTLVPFPPLPEQRAIATALSDADALIQSLERLIAKKRDIKQGAMQELLTGKKRLPGFEKKKSYQQTEVGVIPEDWDTTLLNKISSMNGRIGWQGLKQSEFTNKSDDPFLITGMNFKDGKIRWDEVYHVPLNRYNEAPPIQLKPDDILITKDGTIGKLLYIDEIPYPIKASLNSHLLVFRPINNSYFPKFLYYQLNSKFFSDYLELAKTGSTFSGLSQEAFGNYLIPLPPLLEQTAIATVLSDMDAEIAALESKLAKARQIKQGMMQELLTGRIRLT